MKKIIASFIIACCLAGVVQAQVTDSSTNVSKKGATKYFYYPEANIYFNEANGNYTFYDAGANTWVTNAQLPSSYSVNKKTPRTAIYYNGADVWTDNSAHQKKYGTKNNKMSPKP